MLKKITLGVGVFAVSAFTVVSMAYAQTSTPSPTTSIMPSPTVVVPSGAPATGRAK